MGLTSPKIAQMCTDVGLRCKQKIPILTPLPLSAIVACNASTLLRFVNYIAQVNLIFDVQLNSTLILAILSLPPTFPLGQPDKSKKSIFSSQTPSFRFCCTTSRLSPSLCWSWAGQVDPASATDAAHRGRPCSTSRTSPSTIVRYSR